MSLEQEVGPVLNGGLVTGLPPHLIGSQESPDCENLDPADPLGATTRPGSTIYGTNGASVASGFIGSGLFPWKRNAGTQYVFAAYGTTIYVHDTATWFSIKTGVSSGGLMNGAALNNLAIIVAHGIAPQVSTAGSTLADLGGTPPTLAKYVAIYSSKCFLAGDSNNPNKLSWSASGNPEDYTTTNDAGSVQVDKDDGDIIQGIMSARLGLYIFKRRSTYILTGTTASKFEVEKIAGVGIVGEYAYATDGIGVFFAADDGVYYAVGKQVSRLSDQVRGTYINIPSKNKIALEVKGEKLFMFHAAAENQENTKALVFAFKRKMSDGTVGGVWAPYSSQPYQVAKTTRDNNLLALTNASTAVIYELDRGTSGDISAYWNTPDMEFGDVTALKTLMRYFLHFKPPTSTTAFTVRVYADGASIGSDYTHSVGTSGSHIIDQFPAQLTSRQIGRTLRMRISWTGQATIYGYRVIADVRSDAEPRR